MKALVDGMTALVNQFGEGFRVFFAVTL